MEKIIITDKQKIEALERIVKTVFGNHNESEITYKSYCKDMVEVNLECYVDDVVKVLQNLDLGDINYSFLESVKLVDSPEFSDKPYYVGYTEITLYLETEYWKRVKELEEENKRLRNQLSKD